MGRGVMPCEQIKALYRGFTRFILMLVRFLLMTVLSQLNGFVLLYFFVEKLLQSKFLVIGETL